jgi:hypothetical protein
MAKQKYLSVRQVVEKVEGASEPWLRTLIREGEVRIQRTGYNYAVLASELPKIARLAADNRTGK